MASKELILDCSAYDVDRVIADQEEIRRYNPQRAEMEQLTAIVYSDPERQICVGYKDVGPDEFWVKGHMPAFALMPGVIMCEAAAQLVGYYAQKLDLLGAAVIGLGGLEEVRFRDRVVPGDRLVLVAQFTRARRGALVVAKFQGFVRQSLVVEGRIMGIALPLDSLPPVPQASA